MGFMYNQFICKNIITNIPIRSSLVEYLWPPSLAQFPSQVTEVDNNQFMLKLCCLQAEGSAEDTEMLHKPDNQNVVEELVTKFQQSTYSRRYVAMIQNVFIIYYNVFSKSIFATESDL